MTIKFIPRLLLLCILAFSSSQLEAQIDDWQLRSQVGVTYSPKKRWDLDASIRYDRNQNLQAFRRTNITLGTSYQLKKHLQIGGSYRFITSYEQNIHRFRIHFTADKKINKRLSIAARTLLQHDVKYLQWDYLQTYNPKWVLRERLTLKYEYSKKWRFSLYSEPFISYRDAELTAYRWRNGIQAQYRYKKQHELGAGFFWQHGMAQNAGQNVGVFLIQYTFDLNKPKAKKKKKSIE
jgi:long-subunit fatty acid transport protein